jgi:CheY-like chemotaxis protein
VKIPTRVLVVDDSETTRSIVRKILSASRFALEIHETNEGGAALNQVRDGRFGMIFLDHDMPGMSGFETLKEIRREDPSIAVVMMATAPDESMSKRANAAGALAFLKKPFYPADVDALLDRHFGMPEH